MRSILLKLPSDKAAHFLGGGFLFALCAPFGVTVGLVFCAAVAAAKEVVHDKLLGQGTPDPWDFWATVAGGGALAGWLHCLPWVVEFCK
jgi:hypothetical protein